MNNETLKFVLGLTILSSILIGTIYYSVTIVRGQELIMPLSPEIEVWSEVSPNPAYLGEDIQARLAITSKNLFDKEVKVDSYIAIFPPGAAITLSEYEDKIPTGLVAKISADDILDNSNYSPAECIFQNEIRVEGHEVTKVAQEHFYVYNYQRPAGNPSLLLKKSLEKGENSTITVTIEIDNIGSGDANNVKIVDSSPKNFTIVNGQPTKNYDTIRPNEHKIHEYTIEPSGEGIFILDSATVTYEDNKENSYLSSSGPFTVKVGILGITLRFWEGDKWVEKYIPLEEQARPSPTPLQTPTPTMKETTIEPTSLDGNSASPPSTEKKMSPEVIAALIMGICAIIAAVISLFRLKNRKE